jgi:pilus assembly protein Flp/PilA
MLHLEYIVAWVRAQTTTGERGASLVEYALLLALIALVCVVAVGSLGLNLRDNYGRNNTSIFGSN